MSKIVGLIREVIIIGDTKEILVEINEDFADSLAENMEILINGHNTAIKDVNENRFRTNLTSVMLESEELDRLIYGSKVSIVLHKSQ
tara:strand:- start:2782 stop:3042 length:261 start_codon:yes stop_codon:yes gene_type:complete